MRTIFFIFASLLQAGVYGQNSNTRLEISPLEGDFYIYTTYSTYQGSSYPANGMYFITTSGAVVIDTPWDTTQFQPLLDSIYARHNKKVIACFATHFHEDRTAGFEYYNRLGINTYSTRFTDSLSILHGMKRAGILMNRDSIFITGQYRYEIFYPGPGHAPDNIVVWFPEQRILYGGCLIKSVDDETLGNLSDANINEYPKSLKRIQRRFRSPKYIIPGHNGWHNSGSLRHTLNMAKKLAALH